MAQKNPEIYIFICFWSRGICEHTILELKADLECCVMFFFLCVGYWMRKHQIFYKHTRALYGVIQVVAGVIKKKKYDDLKRFTSITLLYKIIAEAKNIPNILQCNQSHLVSIPNVAEQTTQHNAYLYFFVSSFICMFIFFILLFYTPYHHWMKAKTSTRTQNMALESYTWYML